MENVWEKHLEVDGQQGEERTKGSKEQEVKGLGNQHLILNDLDRPPETLDRISSSLFSFLWIFRSGQICYCGLEGLLPSIDAVVIVEAGLLPLRQPNRGFVLVSNCLGKYSSENFLLNFQLNCQIEFEPVHWQHRHSSLQRGWPLFPRC